MTENELIERLDSIIDTIKRKKSKSTFVLTHNDAKSLDIEDEPSGDVIKFKFGGITKSAMEKYKLFIKKCVQGAGKAFAMTPEAAALQTDISSKTKDIFLSHLLKFEMEGKPLCVKINNVYYSNFDSQTITDFLFAD